jgi:CHAT domain-containing protein
VVRAGVSTHIRPVVGRLTGFAYGQRPSRLRGPERRDIAPNVRIAVARLDQASRRQPTPRRIAALGVAFLTVAEWERAIDLLEEAVQGEPSNSAFQSDLSAAYLARAAAMEEAEDWAHGLAAAARAVALDPANSAAHFNRALALEGLQLPLAALEAWNDFRKFEGAGPWTDEATRNAKSLQERRSQASPVNDEAEVNTQPLREEIEERLLSEWADALLGGQSSAADRVLHDAEQKAARLVALRGDAMARDEIALIRQFERTGNRSGLDALASGHRLYGQARDEFVRSNLERSADLMADAARRFSASGSAYALWAPIYRAIQLRFRREPGLALSQLRSVPLHTVPADYHNLRGRLAWTEGVMWGASGRPDLEREPIVQAIEEFRTARERDHQIMTTTLLAETDWFLGDQTRAWADLRSALALVGDREWTNRNYHFIIGSLIASGVGLPEVALEFLSARVRLSETPQSRGEALVQRARLHAALGDAREATTDLDSAVQAFTMLDDAGLRESTSTDVEIARAELLSGTDCAAAIDHADKAYPAVSAAVHSIRIVGLLAVRARCRRSLGDLAGARRDLAEAARAFECRRSQLGSDLDRIRAFEQERSAFEALITLEAVNMNDEAAALRTAERSRAGVLTQTWRSRLDPVEQPCPSMDLPSGRSSAGLQDLPPGVAVVYYESLDDRVLTWVLTRGQRTMLSRSTTPSELRRMVAQLQRAIRQGADLAALKPQSDELFNALIAPALEVADRAAASRKWPEPPTVFFVPDGPLFSVPFGALPDARGQPLIRSRAIGIVPSLATFLAASARLSTFSPADVLAIGDGHDPKTSGLPRLPGADAEAAAVGRLYPRGVVLTGGSATRERVLAERRAVVHFAGHTVVNEHNPRYSQMLLAPDPATGDAGRLLGSEITQMLLRDTGVVVLATCDGAAGRVVDGEGAISVARSFFAAGVPAVVASLWPVADDLPEFAQTFHQELIRNRDVPRALRDAQLALLDARGPRTPVGVWGGFIMFGGWAPNNRGENTWPR